MPEVGNETSRENPMRAESHDDFNYIAQAILL